MSNIISANSRRESKFVNARPWPETQLARINMRHDHASSDSFDSQAAAGAVKGKRDSRAVKPERNHVGVNAAAKRKAKELVSPSIPAQLPELGARKTPHAKLLVARVEALVLKALPVRLSEEFFAKVFCVELRELHTAFRVVRGVGLHAALRTMRIVEVKRRLDADEDLSIDVAMRQCGFASYAWFRREFFERFGVDPKELRRASYRPADSDGLRRRESSR